MNYKPKVFSTDQIILAFAINKVFSMVEFLST